MSPSPRRRPTPAPAAAIRPPATTPAGATRRGFDDGPEEVGNRRAPWQDGPAEARPAVEQLVTGCTVATGAFVVAAALSAAAPDQLVALGVVVSLTLFAAGSVAFLIGYFRALARSRTATVDLPGLFFLAGSVSARLRRRLLLLFVVQTVVGLAAAATRPFTPLAFCTLAPVFGLGCLSLAGATYGWFPPRRR